MRIQLANCASVYRRSLYRVAVADFAFNGLGLATGNGFDTDFPTPDTGDNIDEDKDFRELNAGSSLSYCYGSGIGRRHPATSARV